MFEHLWQGTLRKSRLYNLVCFYEVALLYHDELYKSIAFARKKCEKRKFVNYALKYTALSGEYLAIVLTETFIYCLQNIKNRKY